MGQLWRASCPERYEKVTLTNCASPRHLGRVLGCAIGGSISLVGHVSSRPVLFVSVSHSRAPRHCGLAPVLRNIHERARASPRAPCKEDEPRDLGATTPRYPIYHGSTELKEDPLLIHCEGFNTYDIEDIEKFLKRYTR